MLIQNKDELNGLLLKSGQGEAYWVLGDLYTFKAVGEDTMKKVMAIAPKYGITIVPPPNGSH